MVPSTEAGWKTNIKKSVWGRNILWRLPTPNPPSFSSLFPIKTPCEEGELHIAYTYSDPCMSDLAFFLSFFLGSEKVGSFIPKGGGRRATRRGRYRNLASLLARPSWSWSWPPPQSGHAFSLGSTSEQTWERKTIFCKLSYKSF